jgi:hypothetical protein
VLLHPLLLRLPPHHPAHKTRGNHHQLTTVTPNPPPSPQLGNFDDRQWGTSEICSNIDENQLWRTDEETDYRCEWRVRTSPSPQNPDCLQRHSTIQRTIEAPSTLRPVSRQKLDRKSGRPHVWRRHLSMLFVQGEINVPGRWPIGGVFASSPVVLGSSVRPATRRAALVVRQRVFLGNNGRPRPTGRSPG